MLGRIKQIKRQYIYVACTIVIVSSLYYYLSIIQLHSWYLRSADSRCQISVEEMKDLKELIRDAHQILEKFELTHFLVYGSLWGAIRMNNPLPWDSDMDFALLSSEMEKVDHNLLYQEFNAKNISIYYRSWLGSYRIDRGKARGDLMVFVKSFFNFTTRTGLERFFLFIHHAKHHIFPTSLIQSPLPKLSFAGMEISVPRNEIEILKYFYPHDWWKVAKPHGC